MKRTILVLAILLSFGLGLSAQTKKQLRKAEQETASKQCVDIGGTWSNFKGRCDVTGIKSPFKDKKWWLGEGIILAEGLASGITTNQHKTGGTHLFGNCGGCTTSGDIALFETAAVAFFTGLHGFEWYLGHDDPNKYWRFGSYAAIPALAASVGVYGIIHNNEVGPPAPATQIRIQSDWLYNMRKH